MLFFFFFLVILGPGLGIPMASLVAQIVKNMPAVRETQAQCLVQEDPLEKGMATHSSILAPENSVDRGPWRAVVHGAA